MTLQRLTMALSVQESQKSPPSFERPTRPVEFPDIPHDTKEGAA
jgi:hypothetical protein